MALYEFFEKVSPLGQSRCLTYCAFLLAEIWRLAEKGQWDNLRAMVGLGAVFIDQVAVEGGRTYQLGWLMTGLEEPPFSSVEGRVPSKLPTTVAHSRLAEPRWVAASLGFLRDMDTIAERTMKLGKGRGRGRGRKGDKDSPEDEG